MERKTYPNKIKVLKNWNNKLTAVTIDSGGSDERPHRVTSEFQVWDTVNKVWAQRVIQLEFVTRPEAIVYADEMEGTLRKHLMKRDIAPARATY